MEDVFLSLVFSLLRDEHGISEDSWNTLQEVASLLNQKAMCVYSSDDDIAFGDAISEIKKRVEATDGRFYLPSPEIVDI